MSNASDERSTPAELFNVLNDIFAFDLDPAATAENAKCERYYSKDDDGLSQPWSASNVFVNPPYLRGQIKKWIEKAVEEVEWSSRAGRVVMVLPCDPSTRWFKHVWVHARALWFASGRFKFNGMKTGARFATLVAIFQSIRVDYLLLARLEANGGRALAI